MVSLPLKTAIISAIRKSTLRGAIQMAKFEIYKDKKGQFRWRLLANNNQVIATGEGYTTKASCKNGIESVKKNAPKAEIEDLS
jgi:uncharacterized protein YegP (UPF0339 family)